MGGSTAKGNASGTCVVKHALQRQHASGRHKLIAAIPAGTEANISYIDLDMPVGARRAELQRCFNFLCRCSRKALISRSVNMWKLAKQGIKSVFGSWAK
eukprot:1161971-Pelagomonas_calceolata.AAC.10